MLRASPSFTILENVDDILDKIFILLSGPSPVTVPVRNCRRIHARKLYHDNIEIGKFSLFSAPGDP